MEELLQFFGDHGLRILDILGAVVGLIYIYLEYRASIYLWLVGIIMPLIDMWLYFEAGLYADFGMAIYYALAAIYGYVMWRFFRRQGTKGKERLEEQEARGKGQEVCSEEQGASGEGLKITHIPLRKLKWVVVAFTLVWLAIYEILVHFTDSTVPVTDSFVNALSIIGLWALAQKYIEQWLIWIIVDAFCCGLYTYKGIPFKAGLYGLYVIIAIFGYFKWKRMMKVEG